MTTRTERATMGLWIALACVLALASTARAQYDAPAGNAHPTSAMLSEDADATNPFGRPEETTFDYAKKSAFAKAVDLSPLADLAVFHNGRVKIVDTLARETVQAIMGRRDFQDFNVARKPGLPDKVRYSPLFTFFDLVIDPAYYLDRPLIHVNYLPLREEYLLAMGKKAGSEEYEWWKRVGRLKPSALITVGPAVEEKLAFDQPTRRGIDRVRSAFGLYQNSWRNLQMVAPEGPDKPWAHLSQLKPGTPGADAALRLGAAWRAGDAAGVNAAARDLAAAIPNINPASYPTSRRELELSYNNANAFEWGYWLYAMSFLSLVLAFGTGRRWLRVLGLVVFFAALSVHGFGFVARCIIAERFAIQNQFESMTGISLFAALVGLGLMVFRRQYLFAAAAAGVGFMVLVTATQTGIPGVNVEREAAILNTSVLLKYHVTTVLVSYGLIALGMIVSLFYLGTHYAARARGGAQAALAGGGSLDQASADALGIDAQAGGPVGTARVLADLDKAQMIILQLAFWTLGVGILLGAWWADHSWGRWWAFDPKELWALVTWIVYLIVIHLRLTQTKNRAITTAWLSVVGFVVMLWTYFGVNLLLPGLHAYA
jgi:cytochrome c-type biogenesis protein CcsB